jgi:hypothetical protein
MSCYDAKMLEECSLWLQVPIFHFSTDIPIFLSGHQLVKYLEHLAQYLVWCVTCVQYVLAKCPGMFEHGSNSKGETKRQEN